MLFISTHDENPLTGLQARVQNKMSCFGVDAIRIGSVGGELKCTVDAVSGNTLQIATGMGMAHGLIWESTDVEQIQIFAQGTYRIYAKIDLSSEPATITFGYDLASSNFQQDNLIENPNGIYHQILDTVVVNASGAMSIPEVFSYNYSPVYKIKKNSYNNFFGQSLVAGAFLADDVNARTFFINSGRSLDANDPYPLDSSKLLDYKSSTSVNFYKTLYMKGNSIFTEGGNFNLGGGSFNTGGGYVSTFGSTVYTNNVYLTNTSGGAGSVAFSYKSSTAMNVLQAMYMSGNHIFTEGGNISTNKGTISANGGKVFANSFGIQPTDGSQSTSAITWKDSSTMSFLKNVDMDGRSIFDAGSINAGSINAGPIEANSVNAGVFYNYSNPNSANGMQLSGNALQTTIKLYYDEWNLTGTNSTLLLRNASNNDPNAAGYLLSYDSGNINSGFKLNGNRNRIYMYSSTNGYLQTTSTATRQVLSQTTIQVDALAAAEARIANLENIVNTQLNVDVEKQMLKTTRSLKDSDELSLAKAKLAELEAELTVMEIEDEIPVYEDAINFANEEIEAQNEKDSAAKDFKLVAKNNAIIKTNEQKLKELNYKLEQAKEKLETLKVD